MTEREDLLISLQLPPSNIQTKGPFNLIHSRVQANAAPLTALWRDATREGADAFFVRCQKAHTTPHPRPSVATVRGTTGDDHAAPRACAADDAAQQAEERPPEGLFEREPGFPFADDDDDTACEDGCDGVVRCEESEIGACAEIGPLWSLPRFFDEFARRARVRSRARQSRVPKLSLERERERERVGRREGRLALNGRLLDASLEEPLHVPGVFRDVFFRAPLSPRSRRARVRARAL